LTGGAVGIDAAERQRISTEIDRFRAIPQLVNHWGHQDGRHRTAAYYWMSTFEGAADLHALADRCRREIPFSYYDFIPGGQLHLTLDRIGLCSSISDESISRIHGIADRKCERFPAVALSVGALGGTPGALGFNVAPKKPLAALRDLLREATLSIHPLAPVKNTEFVPHVSIAYCNSAVSAADVQTAVRRLDHLPFVGVTVARASLVRLEVVNRAYTWTTVAHVPLGARVSLARDAACGQDPLV
jgi:2'-5' RNA ligase